MKHEENKRNNSISKASDFLQDTKEADQLFEDIASKLDLDPSLTRHSGKGYRSRFFGRYILRGACMAAAVALVTFGGTGFFQKPSISSVKAAASSDASSARITFRVDALFPVSEISASMNEKSVSVDSLGNRDYAIEVNENGYLLLEAVSISGIKSTQGMTIHSIDDQAPVITSHAHVGDQIRIYAHDIGGSGIDYSRVSASTDSAGMIVPESYEEMNGLIIFPYPSEDMYITIPDKNGNRLVSLLQPGTDSYAEEIQ